MKWKARVVLRRQTRAQEPCLKLRLGYREGDLRSAFRFDPPGMTCMQLSCLLREIAADKVPDVGLPAVAVDQGNTVCLVLASKTATSVPVFSHLDAFDFLQKQHRRRQERIEIG